MSKKAEEKAVIEWYKKNVYSQGDSYHARISKTGKWIVGHSNDYPMQHGKGKEIVLSEKQQSEIRVTLKHKQITMLGYIIGGVAALTGVGVIIYVLNNIEL